MSDQHSDLDSTGTVHSGLIDTTQLYLLQPYDLVATYTLTKTDAALIRMVLQALKEAFLNKLPGQGVALITTALQQLGTIDMTTMPETYATGTMLKSTHADIVDRLMNIQHVQSSEPAKVVAASLLNTAQACLKLLHSFPSFDAVEAERLGKGFLAFGALYARVCGLETIADAQFAVPTLTPSTTDSSTSLPIPEEAKVDNLWVWQQAHRIFLTFVQGLTLAFRRLCAAADRHDMTQMRQEMETATQFMWASGAAMKLAGNFDKQIYHQDIRPTMTVGDPKSMVEIEVSGIMFWDHHYLVNVIWKKEIAGLLRNLPTELEDLHREFVHAYKNGLSAGHIDICARFGGRETTSLLSSKVMAVDFLEKLETSRLRKIDPMQRVSR